MGPERTEVARPTWRDYVSMLRVTQWQKNYVVLAALFFALGDRSQHIALANALRVIPAAFLFCLVSSGIYVLNDILDLESDRSHPVKRMRAIAAGRIPVARARIIALALLVAAVERRVAGGVDEDAVASGGDVERNGRVRVAAVHLRVGVDAQFLFESALKE